MLFNGFMFVFALICRFFHKKSLPDTFNMPGELRKQQECRIKLLSDVVSRSHSSDYFFRS